MHGHEDVLNQSVDVEARQDTTADPVENLQNYIVERLKSTSELELQKEKSMVQTALMRKNLFWKQLLV